MTNPGQSGSTIALFPGGFKPPHAAHLAAIDYLLNCVKADIVVIIIANRSRRLPNSNQAIDANLSRSLFVQMLRIAKIPLNRVVIEIAEHRAIDHAIEYFARAEAADRLLFCIGDADAMVGDARFSGIEELSQQRGIYARVEVIPPAPYPVRATMLRSALAEGDQELFTAGLPAFFLPTEKLRLWHDAKACLKPVAEIARSKITPMIAAKFGVTDLQLRCRDTASAYPEFYFLDDNGDMHRVRYAGDDVLGAECGTLSVEPTKERLAIERRAIKRVRPHLGSQFSAPEIVCFDKRHRLLILNTGAGLGLDSRLASNQFSVEDAAAVGRLLSTLHRIPFPMDALRHTVERDAASFLHESSALIAQGGVGLSERSTAIVNRLFRENGDLIRPNFTHMRFSAKNIVLEDNGHGLLIDAFDKSVTRGDPAFDLATILTDYFLAGTFAGSLSATVDAINALIAAYCESQGRLSENETRRVVCYVALRIGTTAGTLCDRSEIINELVERSNEIGCSSEIPNLLAQAQTGRAELAADK